MGFHRGPNIIREDLLLAFDAANSKSYPGTGTTWTGLGSSVTAALTGASFDTDSISFNGTSDYAYLTGTVNLGTEFSIMSWIKPSDLYGNKNLNLIKIGKMITPSENEILINSRSRSAKLRIAERI